MSARVLSRGGSKGRGFPFYSSLRRKGEKKEKKARQERCVPQGEAQGGCGSFKTASSSGGKGGGGKKRRFLFPLGRKEKKRGEGGADRILFRSPTGFHLYIRRGEKKGGRASTNSRYEGGKKERGGSPSLYSLSLVSNIYPFCSTGGKKRRRSTILLKS